MSYLATLRYDPTLQINPGDAGCYFKGDLALGDWDGALGDLLGFCACGAPDLALDYVRRVLKNVKRIKEEGWESDDEAWDVWWKTVYLPSVDELFHGDKGAEYLVYYLLDAKGLLEHGGSVPGWLTDLGEAVLADLERCCADQTEDD
jgi:hypothetical protein